MTDGPLLQKKTASVGSCAFIILSIRTCIFVTELCYGDLFSSNDLEAPLLVLTCVHMHTCTYVPVVHISCV